MKIVVLDKNKTESDNLKVNFLGVLDELDLDHELDLAHEDYIKRKNEIITKLYTIWKNNEIPTVYRNWIRQAARFINEREI